MSRMFVSPSNSVAELWECAPCIRKVWVRFPPSYDQFRILNKFSPKIGVQSGVWTHEPEHSAELIGTIPDPNRNAYSKGISSTIGKMGGAMFSGEQIWWRDGTVQMSGQRQNG